MDFKSLISKIESIDGPIETPKAPEKAAPIRLDEDTELRVLAGVTALTESIIAEKAVSKAQQKFMGMVHATQKGEKPASEEVAKVAKDMKKKDAEDYASTKHKGLPEKKKSKKESIEEASEAQKAAREKFMNMVKGKKEKKSDKKEESVKEAAKPDFLDMDKDGDKKEPMKKAVKDKKVKEDLKKVGDTVKTHKGGTVTKTAKGVKHERDPESYDDGSDDSDSKSGKGTKSHAKSQSAAEKKERAPKQKQSKTGTWGMKDGEKFDNRKKTSESVEKKVVAESVEQKLSLKDMLQIVKESGGQQAIDPVDQALWAWANRVAVSKIQESQKAEIFAAMIYERNGGRFEMYDVLSEDQK